ncbi:MAG: amino acid permease [Planctomycetes bacterium]|nr:amino acid permease [Planctomycetota bacterium]
MYAVRAVTFSTVNSARPDLPRTLGFWPAIGVMVGVAVGSGIFKTPVSIAQALPDPTWTLVLWGVGGVLSLLGALAFTELATAMPASGGIYTFLRQAYGKPMAFVFGWTYMLITKPSAAAGIAMVFAEAVRGVFKVDWDPRVITIAALIGLTILNVIGTRLSAGVSLVSTIMKFAALIALVVCALTLVKGTTDNFAAPSEPISLRTAIVGVMASIMWTYDGWSDVGAIAGEVKEPQRNLPRIYLLGTMAIMGIYLAVNASMFWALPQHVIANNTMLPAARILDIAFGAGGVVVILGVIGFSTLTSSHASVLTGARVTFAQARDGLLFSFLAKVSSRGTPAVALWTQCILSISATLMLGTFSKLADTFVFTMWIFYGLAAAAVVILRITQPNLPRPYRCWGYPVVPIVFVLVALAMTALAIYEDYQSTLPWIGVLLAGFPVYFVWRRLFPEPVNPESTNVVAGPDADKT